MVEKDCNEDKNPSKLGNKSKKTLIKSYTTYVQLNTLGYRYINIEKGVFFDKYEQPNMIEYYSRFLKKLETFSFYLIEFCKYGSIEPKLYSSNCVVNNLNKRLIIFIIHNKSTFYANNSWY